MGGVPSPPEYARTTFFTFSTSSSSPGQWGINFSRIAICTCSRFSASSNTADRGPSMTSAVISSPRAGGKAVHHDRILPGDPEQVRVDPVPAERGEAFPPLLFLPHARPHVGVRDVRPPCRLDRVPQPPHVTPSNRLR